MTSVHGSSVLTVKRSLLFIVAQCKVEQNIVICSGKQINYLPKPKAEANNNIDYEISLSFIAFFCKLELISLDTI